MALLPSSHKPVDAETLSIIQQYHGSWLLEISDQSNAIKLLNVAASHPHQTTISRLRDEGLMMDGIVRHMMASDGASIHYAFDADTFAPLVMKFGGTVNFEFEIFRHLSMSVAESMASSIVPILSYFEDDKGKRGIVMPVYPACLQQVEKPMTDSAALLNGIAQIVGALNVLHRHDAFHNNITPQTILLDGIGNWHLWDFGSCFCDAVRPQSVALASKAIIPRDLVIDRCCAAFDHLLLGTTVVTMLGFAVCDSTLSQLNEFVASIEDISLRNALSELLMKQ